MSGNAKNDRALNTGGGAYIGGGVDTGGGTFVGRDQITVTSPPNASLPELQALVAELKRLLQDAKLPAKIGGIVEGDFERMEQQVVKESPNGAIVKSRLDSLKALLSGADAATGSVEKILTVIGKAAQLAGLLFP